MQVKILQTILLLWEKDYNQAILIDNLISQIIIKKLKINKDFIKLNKHKKLIQRFILVMIASKIN